MRRWRLRVGEKCREMRWYSVSGGGYQRHCFSFQLSNIFDGGCGVQDVDSGEKESLLGF